MKMLDAALVLEGGGMRGVYTAGVLDFLLGEGLMFDTVYGVSAGACHACSYLSRQQGRALRTNTDYLEDKRYCSFRSLLTTGNLFGVDMIYDEIPNKLDLFDYDAYDAYEGTFYAVVTNCETGMAEYHPVRDMQRDIISVRASSSLPMVSRNVMIDGTPYLDGGVSDAIPYKQAIKDGKQAFVVLTQADGYEKKPNNWVWTMRPRYRKYPNLLKLMRERHLAYNKTLKDLKTAEEKGEVLVIRPGTPVDIGRLEKDKEKLVALYRRGYEDAAEMKDVLYAYLEAEVSH